MDWRPASVIGWLFDATHGLSDRFIARWLFLRALGLIYFSAFFSLIFQIRGLMGPTGILPAKEYLEAVSTQVGHGRFWYAPTILWLSSSSQTLMALCWVGTVASLLLVLNFWPRGMLLICFICFISFVSAASEFSGYQSDGMLLEAGFVAMFLAPPGFRSGLGKEHRPMRAAVFLLLWEWFRIYFESGIAKIASGDPEWRHFTAMDEYYQNGPLPTWIGWYVQHFPHWFHVATAFGTLALELVLAWMLFLPRRWRIILFFIVTPWQIGIILTANYTFLNYLVLVLGFLLLDDAFLRRFLPGRWRERFRFQSKPEPAAAPETPAFDVQSILRPSAPQPVDLSTSEAPSARSSLEFLPRQFATLKLSLIAVMLTWLSYASAAQMIWMIVPGFPLPSTPVAALAPFRIADRYGLFAVMTRGRYEIEFQGSADGKNWTAYPFRYKPQDPAKPPGIYAPYQPRFDWNLWFASLGGWRANPLVARTEERLLEGSSDVLALFALNPFAAAPPRQVRAVLWQYWFTTPGEKRVQGLWWRRELLGLYAPTLEREPDGKIAVIEWPGSLPERQ